MNVHIRSQEYTYLHPKLFPRMCILRVKLFEVNKLLTDKLIFTLIFFSGKTDKVKKKPAFRPHYNQLGELRSFVGPQVPVVALRATATQKTKEAILKTLCMKDCEEIIVTPNKKNIKFWVYEMKTTSENFNWLVNLLEKYGEKPPRMLIFFRQIGFMK